MRLYQGVTLGAKRFETDDGRARCARAIRAIPIVEDDVVIYAGATILGRVTIGKGSSIGGNVWLTQSVPPGSNHAGQAAPGSLQQRRGHLTEAIMAVIADGGASALWRRAIQALAQAFDTAREGRRDTVVQTDERARASATTAVFAADATSERLAQDEP